MSYDSWKTTDPNDNPRLDAMWEAHLETCENCLRLGRDRHLEECSECGHLWHGRKRCAVTQANSNIAVVLGAPLAEQCECEEDGGLSDQQISDLQAKCFKDYMEGLRDDAAERKYEAWRDQT